MFLRRVLMRTPQDVFIFGVLGQAHQSEIKTDGIERSMCEQDKVARLGVNPVPPLLGQASCGPPLVPFLLILCLRENIDS
jgi:hypothetical protein